MAGGRVLIGHVVRHRDHATRIDNRAVGQAAAAAMGRDARKKEYTAAGTEPRADTSVPETFIINLLLNTGFCCMGQQHDSDYTIMNKPNYLPSPLPHYRP